MAGFRMFGMPVAWDSGPSGIRLLACQFRTKSRFLESTNLEAWAPSWQGDRDQIEVLGVGFA